MLKYLIILNPVSGSRRRRQSIVDMIDLEMRKSNHYYEYAFTSKPGDATNLAIQGVLDGFDLVIAAGGDGTINEVATGLINKRSSLGIIPLGSGNGIARSLNIPLDLKGSIEFLLNPTISKIDVGMFNKRYFFGICGIGFDAQIGKRFQNFGPRGPLPYFFIGIQEFLFYQPEVYILKFNGMEMEIKAQLIAIANTKQYGNGAIIAPDADPKDGFLELCILKSLPLWQALDLTYKLFSGKINNSAQYVHYKCKSIYIQSSNDYGPIHADGEPFIRDQELSIEIINNALSVCAPI